MKYLFVIFLTAILIVGSLFIALVIVSSTIKNIDNQSPAITCTSVTNHPIYIQNTASINLIKVFQYEYYLDSTHWCDMLDVNKSLYDLKHTLASNSFRADQIISIALTEKLKLHLLKDRKQFTLDEIQSLINWAYSFDCLSKIDSNAYICYNSIFMYWMNYSTNYLCQLQQVDYSSKFNSKFIYINNKLREIKFGCPIDKSNFEKVIDNFVIRDYSRILNKFITRTSHFQKILLAFICLYIPYSIYFILHRTLLNRYKK